MTMQSLWRLTRLTSRTNAWNLPRTTYAIEIPSRNARLPGFQDAFQSHRKRYHCAACLSTEVRGAEIFFGKDL